MVVFFVLIGMTALGYFTVKYIKFGVKKGRVPLDAAAEHARIQRDTPNSPDAKLSKDEFIKKTLDSMPGMGVVFVKYMGLGILSLIASCTAGIFISR